MVLARDVHDGAGRVVMRAGCAVDAAVRARLEKLNIRKVEIRDGDAGGAGRTAAVACGQDGNVDAGKSDSIIIQGHLMKIAHMFNDHRNDPIMRELCRLAIKCAQERLISA